MRRTFLCTFITVFMLFFSYWVTSWELAISGETLLMRKVEQVRGFFVSHNNPMRDSVLLVNVAYDRENVIVKDKYDTAGYGQITDRHKLYQLLKELKHKDDSLFALTQKQHYYKYILLDVIFDADIHTPADSALFSLIASMYHIVIPKNKDVALADTSLDKKAGLGNYYTNYKNVSFTKFPYLVDGKRSLPLRMYEEMTGHTITDHRLFATDGWRLARKSIMPVFELRCDSAYMDDGSKTWYNMGRDLVGSTYLSYGSTLTGTRELYDNPMLTRDKYIIIGAFSGGDMHYSYLENQPGSAILFNVFLSLMHGHHKMSFFVALILFVAFYYLSWRILSGKTIDAMLEQLPQKNHSVVATMTSFVAFMGSWMGYSMFLSLLCIFTYLTMNEVYDISITATAFKLLSMAVTKVKKIKNKKQHA